MIKNLLLFLSYFVNRFPEKTLLWFGDVLGSGWYWLLPIRRKTVQENLTLVFPELSRQQMLSLSRANYRHYGRVLMESLASLTWDRETYLKRVQLDGVEHVDAVRVSGRGAFFLTAHFGNWELAIGSTTAGGIPLDVIVKKSPNPKINELLQWYRRRTGVGIFYESGTAKDILKSINAGRFVGFIFDQFMGPPIGLPVEFFGRTAGTPVALALLTEKGDTPVLLAYSYRDAQGKLHTVFGPPLVYGSLSQEKNERLYQKTQVYNFTLEQIIRKHPEQWLWLHRRWKPYRGEPRWKLPSLVQATVSALIIFLIAGCAHPGASSTGIEIPKEPTVATPEFKAPSQGEEDDFAKVPAIVLAPPAPPKEKVVMSKKKRRPSSELNINNNINLKKDTAPKFSTIRPDRIPFEVGERLEIELNWTALPAGKATLEVRKGPDFNGRPTFQLWANVLSSRLVDTIYHVNNTIESFVDEEGLIPYKFLLHMEETLQNKETRVLFDHTKAKALYWSNRMSKRWGDEVKDRTDDLVPGSRDMWSGLYIARALNYKIGQPATVDVYENGKAYKVDLLPLGMELISGKAGTFQCIKLKVQINLNNVLAPTGDMFLWLSDDSKRYIVRFDAKLKIGILRGSLVSLRDRQ